MSRDLEQERRTTLSLPTDGTWAEKGRIVRRLRSGFPTNPLLSLRLGSSALRQSCCRDARPIWVNPAGLGVQREASTYLEVAVGDPGAKGRLRQLNAGFNARGLSFGYQRDALDNGQRGHTYRFGLAGGSGGGGLAAGFDVTHYRGDGTKATAWDVGASYVAYPGLNLGIVLTNIGQPVVRGEQQRLTYIPGATWRPSRLAAFGFSTYARI